MGNIGSFNKIEIILKHQCEIIIEAIFFQELDTATFHRIQSNPITLTAFAVLGFIENKYNLTSQYRNAMNKGIDYVAGNWKTIKDPYDLSLVTYTLHKAVHPDKVKVIYRVSQKKSISILFGTPGILQFFINSKK